MKKSRHHKNYKVISNVQDIKTAILKFNGSVFRAYENSYVKAIDEFYEYIIRVLDQQKYKWKPLNEEYKKWKNEEGLDTRILIATKFYRDNIVKEVGEGYAFVGVKAGVKHVDQDGKEGIELTYLAKIHEWGTIKSGHWVPPRPLWRPAISVFIRRWNKEHKNEMLVNMKKEFKGG